MVICLEQDADLHMAQLMPLPLTVSCFSKIQIGFTFLVPAHLASPGKRAVKRVCVCCREALIDTAIRPSICPSPRHVAAPGYRHTGCLQLSHVQTANPSVDGRRSTAS